MAWLFLVLAGLFEMISVTLINKYHQARSIRSLAFLIAGFGASFLFLSLAMKELPMSTAYAVWTGIGAAGGAAMGIIFYGEPKSPSRVFFILLVVGSAIALKLIS
jgi:paired small multidrug resistance pump